MTQCQIDHPEGLAPCAAGHSARHIHDGRSTSAGGGHFVECRCTKTPKHADPDAALASWRRLNRPARVARKAPEPASNVVQIPLRLAAAAAGSAA
ncbi:hypothetical protein CXF96_05350 [Stenotrophomonas sp. Betaine-02u-21]|uniref:hypothetical protein n=1 Tax=unclassified Stenotrophomonas TaxID=196198 RepID=UPI000C346626|nr:MULTISPECIES: hypothetical protein [unclassified Stenotrophomonas]PKH70271.1 hypothetical protein CXF90_15355 [Stenotrophomonas sp. Betaine-02u-23]PKH75164.1 hypothetical protein CXF96_05350 [Stenotrophomonas sp. Betaine-02u-21]PKH97587.1 hypothetical protein CXG43_01780 [Stenotrophomonas sp. Bg11-02]